MTIVRWPIHGIAYDDELEACPACATEPAMDERWQAMAERPKIVPMLHRGIEEHRDRLKGAPVWQNGNRHPITLTNEPSVRVVLTVLQPGSPLREHHANGPLTFCALSGDMVCGAREAALESQESRGGHTRDDYPMADDRFGKVNVVIRPKNGCASGSSGGRRLSRGDYVKVPASLARTAGARPPRHTPFMLPTVQPHYLSRTGRVQVPTRGDFPFAPSLTPSGGQRWSS